MSDKKDDDNLPLLVKQIDDEDIESIGRLKAKRVSVQRIILGIILFIFIVSCVLIFPVIKYRDELGSESTAALLLGLSGLVLFMIKKFIDFLIKKYVNNTDTYEEAKRKFIEKIKKQQYELFESNDEARQLNDAKEFFDNKHNTDEKLTVIIDPEDPPNSDDNKENNTNTPSTPKSKERNVSHLHSPSFEGTRITGYIPAPDRKELIHRWIKLSSEAGKDLTSEEFINSFRNFRTQLYKIFDYMRRSNKYTKE